MVQENLLLDQKHSHLEIHRQLKDTAVTVYTEDSNIAPITNATPHIFLMPILRLALVLWKTLIKLVKSRVSCTTSFIQDCCEKMRVFNTCGCQIPRVLRLTQI